MRKGSKHSPETIEKNRLKHIGKKDSFETLERKRQSHIGEKNGFYGKKHSEETKEKMHQKRSESTCKKMSDSKKGIIPKNIDILKASRIGSTNTEEHRQKVSITMTGIVRSEETKQKISENRSGINCGSNNAAWNGGSSYFPYCPKFNERRKKAVRTFFGNMCISCNKEEASNIVGGKTYKLAVHHIDHDKTQGCKGIPFNLVPLCHECHNTEQFNKEEYRKYINYTLDSGFAMGVWSREQYEREVMYPE